MKEEEEFLLAVPYALDEEEFISNLQEWLGIRETHQHDPLESLLVSDFFLLSKEIDETILQDSWCWRNVHIARQLAYLLTNEEGEIKQSELLRAQNILEENLYSIAPGSHHDTSQRTQLLTLIRQLGSNELLTLELKRISRPTGHSIADKLIRETLLLKENEPLTDAHAKRAVLSALFTKLRQNVGSCFATAPAILIQQEQPLQFLQDMNQLLGTGRLSRIIRGSEYTVPLSLSWGVGDLYRPFALFSLGKDPYKTLSHSPGLLAALHAAGLIETEGDAVQRRKWCEQILRKNLFVSDQENFFTELTPDKILHSILLNYYGITEEVVENYRQRAREGVRENMIIPIPQLQEGKSFACARFLKGYELAKAAFKAITDNPLLKAWEYTLASLSESQGDFASWNLYASLGFAPEEPNGVGECLYQIIQHKITKINEEIAVYQTRYDHVYAQLKSLEGRAARAASESEAGWIQAEYQTRKFELHRILSERDEMYEKGKELSQLFPFLVSFYNKKFKEYFQEVYDADMHEVAKSPYDDSPAGFRLLYKHGRTNTALWTLIYTPAEYIQSLVSFFMATEIELVHLPEIRNVQHDLEEIITAIVTHIRRPEFLESSFYHLALSSNFCSVW